MADQFMVRVKMVEYHIRIALVAGSKHDYLAQLAQLLQQLNSVGAHVDSCLNPLPRGELYLKGDIVGETQVIVAVD